MNLADSLAEATSQLLTLGQAMQALTAQPLVIDATVTSSSDTVEADAIKRGQKPQSLEALRKALGL
jgi:hypothetical protein